MRPASWLLEVLGRDVELRLHLPSTKRPIHYLVGSQAMIFLWEMGSVIFNRNKTKWTNTDTRTSHRAFYEPTHNQQIATHELGGLGRLMISCDA